MAALTSAVRTKKIYFNTENYRYVDAVKNPSKVVNMACEHLRFTMTATVDVIKRQFDQQEIDAILTMFIVAYQSTSSVYFKDIEEARAEIRRINVEHSHQAAMGWGKGFDIMMRFCDVQTINAFLYLSKFADMSETR